MDFDDITYLRFGNKQQQKAYSLITELEIFKKLENFEPKLVGTIPLEIDVEKSDLDIICYFEFEEIFGEILIREFKNEKGFTYRKIHDLESPAVLANFWIEPFEIEIFGQNTPTHQQSAYRHMLVEYKLLNKFGEKFKQKIIELKRKGHKTEPAFAIALGLAGNPYSELLKFEKDNFGLND